MYIEVWDEDLDNMFEFKDFHNEEFCKIRNMDNVR